MRLVIAWVVALALAAITAGSCSINHRTDGYQCDTQAECSDHPGTTCSGGYCIQTGTPMDAPRNDAAPGCPVQCSSCKTEKMECTIDCSIKSCNAAVVCPAGWNCNILCNTANSCTQGLDCSDAESCTLTCSGTQSCRDLECGTGRCRVMCTGSQACREMNCSQSCACDLTCAPTARCTELLCPMGCGGVRACTSVPNGCDDCNDGM